MNTRATSLDFLIIRLGLNYSNNVNNCYTL